MKNYQYKITQQNPPNLEPVHQVVVTVWSDELTAGTVGVNYTVSNAGWSPSYDLRAKDTGSPVSLTYKAQVHQNTGIDWESIRLKLSTINPNQNKNKPVLPVWYLNYYVHQQIISGGEHALARNFTDIVEEASAAYKEFEKDKQLDDSFLENKKLPLILADKNQVLANVEFNITMPYTIKSGGNQHYVAVQTHKLNADYYHYLVPKLDKDAFLMAKITDWEDLNLLPAQANIYYQSTYIGKSYINPSVLADTLELSLGRDRGILVTRKKLKDEEREKIIGKNKVKNIRYELAIKNLKSTVSKLIIEDQSPVSSNDDISVKLEENETGDYNEKTGKLLWKLNLDARKSETLKFAYSIKYDKNKQLLGAL